MIKDFKLLIELPHTYGTSVGILCKTEMLSKYKLLILMIILMKIKQNIIQSGHIFQIFQQNINNWWFWIRKKTLFNLISDLPDIDEIYLYAKDPYEAQYQYLTNKR